jgi:anti-sigma B factor antagonist
MQMPPFAFEILGGDDESTQVLRLTGPLVQQTIPALQENLAKQHPSVTIFDLSGVPSIDSAGMQVIIDFYSSTIRRGQRLIVAGTNNGVLELFKRTHADRIIPMAASVEEAEARWAPARL